MSFEPDEELLEDFLIEAGEILESLSEQLVELENSPDDTELLNSIFRGFHTIKGGAGFLNLTTLVEVSHVTENVFDILRNHERKITADLMDVILQSLDTVNNMFTSIKEGELPDAANSELLEMLATYSKPESEDNSEGSSQKEVVQKKTEISTSSDEMSDVDFEALLDDLHGVGQKPGAHKTTTPEIMNDDDFDSLLDEIHGKGKGPTDRSELTTTKTKAKKPIPTPQPKAILAAEKKPAAKKSSKTTSGETTLRVDTKRLDDIMNMVGELVLVRNRMNILSQEFNDEALSSTVQNLDLVTGSLQTAVMKTRMQPIKKVFGRFPRVVRDLARTLKKEINLELMGEETDLDKNLVEALADPLVHLVRNSVDHGVEIPDVREQSGKERCGNIVLAAAQEGDNILLTITDDGAGMNADQLRAIAVKKSLMDEDAAARLSDNECYNLIFAPGFSTKTEISDVSGRGVGMDVVKTKISQLNGTVDIDSEVGKGTTVNIKIPLTLAIMSTLMVVVGKQVFALPLASVSEIFYLDLSKTNTVDGQQAIIVREKAIPLFYLEHWLIADADTMSRKKQGHVIIYQVGNRRVAFVVDGLVGQEEVVIKALGKSLSGTPGIAGATITSDGGIALILDVPTLLTHYSGRG